MPIPGPNRLEHTEEFHPASSRHRPQVDMALPASDNVKRMQGVLPWNLRMTGELVKIVELLEVAGVRVIPYKGPALAMVAYGDLSSREFSDLDLLIERAGFDAAHRVMIEAGYEPEIELSQRQWPKFMTTTNVLAYRKSNEEITVELHWELSPRYMPFPYDFDALYERREPCYPGGREVMTLSGSDLLFYLCLHGAKHAWERRSWILDVGGLIKHHQAIDWDRIITDALRFGYGRTLALGLALAHRVTGISLRKPAMDLIERDEIVKRLVEQIISRLASVHPRLTMLTLIRFLLSLQEDTAGRARIIYLILTNPSVEDWRLIRLPPLLTGLYVILRPVRLLMTFILSRAQRDEG